MAVRRGLGPIQVGLVTGSQVWVSGIKLSFVCRCARVRVCMCVCVWTLFCLSLGAETRGTVLTEAAGIEEREREEGGGDLEGQPCWSS